MSHMELFANLMTVICIVLAGRNNIHTWWTGIVACIAFGVVFYDAKLYADVTLQVFFVATSVYGWWQWHQDRGAPAAAITFSGNKENLISVFFAMIVTGVYGGILHKYTDASLPFLDSIVLAGSIIGQLMLMRRKFETWGVWVIVNAVSVYLYLVKGLYITAFLYACFFVHAFYAAWTWYKIKAKASE